MLVLSRRAGERIQIGADIWITVVRIGPNTTRLGIEAPEGVKIIREEIADVPKPNQTASNSKEQSSGN